MNEDRQLMEQILYQPEKGLEQAMELYGDAVYSVCRSVLRGYDTSQVEEAWEETFVRLWKYAKHWKPEKNRGLKAYLCTIARNAAIQVMDRNGRHAAAPFEEELFLDSGMDLEQELIGKEKKQVVHQALEQLPEPDRSIFILRFFYCMTAKEIGEKLNFPVKKVQNRLSRGKEALREKLIKGGISDGERI